MKKTLLLLLLIPFSVFSQNCSCEDNFKWVKKTFEENDAGFQYVLDIKGQDSYNAHNEKFAKQVKTIKETGKCITALQQWLLFFRPEHLSLSAATQDNTNATVAGNDQQIRDIYKDWEKYTISEKEFNDYLSKIKEPGLEGIWKTGRYTIGIIKKNNEYIGFIIDADGVYWQKGQVKLRIKPALKGNGYEGTFYMRDHSAQQFSKIKMIGNNFWSCDWANLTRVAPKSADTKAVADYIALITSTDPIAKQISDKTFLLRIPSFLNTEKKKIDSLITYYHDKISSTENLIIDIRNNGGGSDSSYEELLKYLYTNPVRGIGVRLLSTPLNNKRMEDFIASDNSSESTKQWAKKGLEKLNANLGKFVSLNNNDVSLNTMDSIYTYPKNVAILINENNGSTAEQFLLEAKQSKKVKLFGTTTMGVLDISNMYSVDSPCKTMKLGYALSKSMRIPDMIIDGRGIQPDFYLDKTIPDEDWIDYTEKILLAK